MTHLIKSVDVLAMPSFWEAGGSLAMENLMSELLAVLSGCDALRDIGRGAPARVVCKENPAALLEGILSLLKPKAKLPPNAYASVAD